MAESSATLSFCQWRFPNPFQCCLPKIDPFHYQQLPDKNHIDNVDENAIAKSLQQPSSLSPAAKSDDVGVQNLVTSVDALYDGVEGDDRLVEQEMLPPHIDPKTRARCIDSLIDAADRLHSGPAALYLAVNFFDRYLSQNHVEVEHLLLVGLACLTVASKHGGVGDDQFNSQLTTYLRHFQNKIRRDELASTEARVLIFLDNETTPATAWSFLKKFLGGGGGGEAELKSLECMAGYIAEVSLLSSSMLGFGPSVVAASSVFLARYVLEPSEKPWSDVLRRCTTYEASDLRDCVVALHDFCYGSGSYYLPAVTIKYSKKKFRYVALKSCPLSIPPHIFED